MKFWTQSPLLLLKISKDIDAVLLKRLDVRRFGDGKKKPRGKKSLLASLTQLKTAKMRRVRRRRRRRSERGMA